MVVRFCIAELNIFCHHQRLQILCAILPTSPLPDFHSVTDVLTVETRELESAADVGNGVKIRMWY